MPDSRPTPTVDRRAHGDHHRAARAHDGARLGRRLELARRRAFVGRGEQIAAFREALSVPAAAPILFLHGAGGTGKTALLHRFADEAARAGRQVVRTGTLGAGIEAPELVRAFAPVVHGRAECLLLIDDLDDWQPAEPWLRERLLPTLPLGTVVAMAGRTPPGLDWTMDPGWRELLRVHEVRELPTDDAELLLDRCAMPRRHHAWLLALTDGHPLALRVAIDALASGLSAEEVSLAVARAVLERVVGPTPTPAHRLALELCATTEVVDESVLGAAGDATALFRWLGSQPYVDPAPGGLRLRPFVRQAVAAERRWRDPVRDDPCRDGLGVDGAGRDGADPAAAGPAAVADRAALPRDEFDTAVRAALHSWRRPDLLAVNPLVTSRLVVRRAEPEPVDALRAALKSVLDQLGQDPRQSKGHRAVVATYLSGAPTQEAAAERLGLPYSTYRRHLAQGLATLLGLLWWQENRRAGPEAQAAREVAPSATYAVGAAPDSATVRS